MTKSYRWLIYTVGILGFFADQASKYGTFRTLIEPGQLSGEKEIVPGAFKFYVQVHNSEHECDCFFVKLNGDKPPHVNYGALFSLGGEHKKLANGFFATVSCLAAIGIALWGLRKSTGVDRWLCLALGLILAGAIGNFYDRIVFGGVRDFLYFYLINWPIFNVADCFLVCGAALLFVQAIFGKPPEMASKETVAV
jgi:signal peptidase II